MVWPGTGIAGLVESLERFVRAPDFPRAHLLALTQRLADFLAGLEGVRLVGARHQRLANTIAFVVQGADSIALLAALDMEGVCASSGSACSAGSIEPSHVVRALGLSEDLAHALVRFSLGRDSTVDDVAWVERVLPEILGRVRGATSQGGRGSIQ